MKTAAGRFDRVLSHDTELKLARHRANFKWTLSCKPNGHRNTDSKRSFGVTVASNDTITLSLAKLLQDRVN
jgi:hypothetical protein